MYISHLVLHQKHPIFSKMDVATVKRILADSKIIYLSTNQYLYKAGDLDEFIYFILFGSLMIQVPYDSDLFNHNDFEIDFKGFDSFNLGRVNMGWTVGEEILYDGRLQTRTEACYSETETCLLGINKSKLAFV